jgi:hypothetical protein
VLHVPQTSSCTYTLAYQLFASVTQKEIPVPACGDPTPTVTFSLVNVRVAIAYSDGVDEEDALLDTIPQLPLQTNQACPPADPSSELFSLLKSSITVIKADKTVKPNALMERLDLAEKIGIRRIPPCLLRLDR